MPVQPVKLNPRRRGNSVPPCQRYTPADFRREYPDDDSCLEYLLQRRWPGGLIWCFKCSKVLRHYKVSGRQSYACRACGSQVHPTAGTIFHKSTTPLTTWFYVMRLMASTRVGVSAKQIQREVGVTYKTAWRMMAQVRKLMAERGLKLAGPVEIDDAVFGGSDTNKHQELRGGGKQTVVGVVSRKSGKVVARVVDDMTKETVQPIVGEVLSPRTTIYSDEHTTYGTLAWMGAGHRHSTVNHSKGWVGADGFAHTQTIDGFWGLVKRGIVGVYHQVGRHYLQSYLNEYSFRTNRRFAARPMFSMLVERGGQQVRPAVWETRRLAQVAGQGGQSAAESPASQTATDEPW